MLDKFLIGKKSTKKDNSKKDKRYFYLILKSERKTNSNTKTSKVLNNLNIK